MSWLQQHIREMSRKIAPDYPGIENDLPIGDHCWAITSTYEGTNAANEDLHNFIRFLVDKYIKLPYEQLIDEWSHERSKTETPIVVEGK